MSLNDTNKNAILNSPINKDEDWENKYSEVYPGSGNTNDFLLPVFFFLSQLDVYIPFTSYFLYVHIKMSNI